MKRHLTETLLAQLTPPAHGRLEVFDVQVSGFGARLGRSGRLSFFAQYRLHGKSVRQALGTYPVMTLPDARLAAAQCADLARAGIDLRGETRGAERRRFTVITDEFLNPYAARHQQPR